jgi:hypothetical protein
LLLDPRWEVVKFLGHVNDRHPTARRKTRQNLRVLREEDGFCSDIGVLPAPPHVGDDPELSGLTGLGNHKEGSIAQQPFAVGHRFKDTELDEFIDKGIRDFEFFVRIGRVIHEAGFGLRKE